jgi:hypothetical protein
MQAAVLCCAASPGRACGGRLGPACRRHTLPCATQRPSKALRLEPEHWAMQPGTRGPGASTNRRQQCCHTCGTRTGAWVTPPQVLRECCAPRHRVLQHQRCPGRAPLCSTSATHSATPSGTQGETLMHRTRLGGGHCMLCSGDTAHCCARAHPAGATPSGVVQATGTATRRRLGVRGNGVGDACNRTQSNPAAATDTHKCGSTQ